MGHVAVKDSAKGNYWRSGQLVIDAREDCNSQLVRKALELEVPSDNNRERLFKRVTQELIFNVTLSV